MFLFNYFLIFFTFLYSETIKINLITTNDLHGKINEQKAFFMNPQYPPTIVGGAAFSKYIDDLKIDNIRTNEGLIILDGGNFFQGSSLGLADNGYTIIEWMNRIGYNALVPGSYDFISGANNLNELSKNATFPFLFSNLDCNECPIKNKNIKPYLIQDILGIKIGILGIVNSKLEELVLNENLFGTYAKKEIPSIKKWVPIMKKDGAEVIIVLTSSGVPWNREKEYENFINQLKSNKIKKNSSLNALQMAYYLEGVDFVVAGGNSKGYKLPWYDPYSHVYVMQGYGGGTEFSHIKLLIDKDSHLFIGYETVIDGKASQTLLADDFEVNISDRQWINSKTEHAQLISKRKSKSNINDFRIIKDLEINNWDIPNINKPNSLEIITWNCEFFPHSNDSTIFALAESIMDLNADIIAFQELRRVGWFSKLMQYLPKYNFVVSKQASFMDLAIIYKSDLFELLRQYEPFADDDYNFAGRPPLQADFKMRNMEQENFSIINLHMKCCDSGLNRRKNASKMLYEYLDSNYNTQSNIIVLGDWNDDTKDKVGEHCFDPFFDDNRFYFTTKEISLDLNQASYPKEPYISFLDHIMISESFLPRSSTFDVRTLPMGKYMGGYHIYEAFISDHLPVLLSFTVTN